MTAWWERLGDRDRRALTLLAVVAAGALAWTFAMRPAWQRIGTLRDQLAAERGLLGRERAALSRPDGEAGREAVPVLFTGRDDAIAAAALAELAGTLAEAHDLWVQAATTGEARVTPDGVRLVRVDVRAEGDVQGIAGWLAALERGPHAVQVGTLEVSAAPTTGDDDTEPLAVRATLIGYAAPASMASWPGPGAPRHPWSPDSLATRVAARNPFAASRRAPPERYRLAIPADALAASPVEEAMPPSRPVVHGTAVGGDGQGFAMCAIDGQPVTVVRVGDRLAGYTVVAIARGRVTFRDARGQRLDITTSAPSDGEQP
jgi:type II secretory pathway component PulM